MLKKQAKRLQRHKRVRNKMHGTAKLPRLCVFRSAKHIYAQLIDDDKGKAICQASDLKVKLKNNKTSRSAEVGKQIAQLAKDKKISQVIFDRAGYKYHGRVKALAEGAREGGLQF